jgi:hypothetical protein
VIPADQGFELSYTLKQIQREDPFSLTVPVAVYLENREEVLMTQVKMDSREKTFSSLFLSRPLKLSVDPQFQLMRKLHYSEVPSSLSQLFGAKQSAILLPGNSPHTDQYRVLAEFFQQTLAVQGKEMEILYDTDLKEIPSEIPVWIAGFRNRYYKDFKISATYQDKLTAEDSKAIEQTGLHQTLVYAMPNPGNPRQTVGFIGTHHTEDILTLARKLVHYGSYGYLGFEGAGFTNVLKGSLPVLKSVLDYTLPYEDQPSITQKLKSRNALAYPPAN